MRSAARWLWRIPPARFRRATPSSPSATLPSLAQPRLTALPTPVANSTPPAFTFIAPDTTTPYSKGLSQRTQLEPQGGLIYTRTQPIAPSTFETQAGWPLLIGYCRIG